MDIVRKDLLVQYIFVDTNLIISKLSFRRLTNTSQIKDQRKYILPARIPNWNRSYLLSRFLSMFLTINFVSDETQDKSNKTQHLIKIN